MDKIWQVKNSSNSNHGELLLFGDISNMDWWDEDVTPQKILDDLDELGNIDKLSVKINSNGGSVFAGITISNVINQYGKDNDVEVTGYVMGLAASIASVIACSLPNLVMYPSSMLMIHNPMAGMMIGNAEEFRKMADDLDSIRESLIVTYQRKTNLTRQEITDMLDNETWLTSGECVEYGFADSIEENDIAASISNNKLIMNGVKFDLNKYKNVPKKLIQNKVNRGVEDNMFKEFKTEKEFNSVVDNIKSDYKSELMKDKEFVANVRKGYVKAGDVLNKFSDLDLESDDLDSLVDSVKEIKNDLESKKEELEKIKKDNLFATRKAKLSKYGVEVKEEDYEDILDYTDKQFKNWTDSLKQVSNIKNKDDDDFDLNPFVGVNDVEDKELSDIIASL